MATRKLATWWGGIGNLTITALSAVVQLVGFGFSAALLGHSSVPSLHLKTHDKNRYREFFKIRNRPMPRFQITIEEWDGDGAIRIPDEALQELGVDVGDTLYLVEEFVDNTRCWVLSKTPQIPDQMDELVGRWDTFGKDLPDA